MRPLFLVVGFLLTVLAGAHLPSVILDAAEGDPEWRAFLVSAVITLFVGASLLLVGRGTPVKLTIRQGFVITVASWLITAVVGALPLLLADRSLDVADAIFESVSGLTTTGATVITGLDQAPAGLLLWRAQLHWLGGIGIIVMTIAIMPMLQIGGMQLFRIEKSEEHGERVIPRAAKLAGALVLAYCALTVANALAFWLAGMSPFDAICHAMSAISTGGFANYDASLAHFDSLPIEVIAMVFMTLGALPFVLYLRAVQGQVISALRDTQMLWFFAMLIGLIALITLWQVFEGGQAVGAAIRESSFAVISLLTTTGFVTENHAAWGSFPVTMLILVMLIGSCTGSTAGGVKVFRLQVLYAAARLQILRLFQPHGVFPLHYNHKPLPEAVLTSVMGFFFFYVFIYVVSAVGLSAFGLDPITSLSGAAAALANVGPGMGDIIGPLGTYAPLPDGAKWLLSATMLLGRLELFPILVLFAPAFWRT